MIKGFHKVLPYDKRETLRVDLDRQRDKDRSCRSEDTATAENKCSTYPRILLSPLEEPACTPDKPAHFVAVRE